VQDFARDLVLDVQPILLSIGKTLGDLINRVFDATHQAGLQEARRSSLRWLLL
jgi:hypothetical protein